MNTPKNILTIGAATLGLALTASPALAGDGSARHGELPTMEVSAAGLDLNTAEGQRILERRIDQAAREVCRADYIATGTRIPSSAARECVAKAKASAERQVAGIVEHQRRGG